MLFTQILLIGLLACAIGTAVGLLVTKHRLLKNEADIDMSADMDSESGLFHEHGMVFDPEKRGVMSDKKFSKYHYDTML